MGAEGSQAGIAIREETVWGEVSAGQFIGVNFTSEDMAFAIENQTSNSIRPDRQTVDLIQVGASTAGGFETEFQATNLDSILPGCFWDVDWNYVDGAGKTGVITAGASGSNLDFTITAASNLLTLGSAVVHNIISGSFVTLAGFVNDGNNGTFFVVNATGQNITLAATTLVDETVQATATIKGDYIKNGVTKHSYSIERANTDISQFFLYKGMVPNVMSMNIESGNPIMVNVSFVGKDETLSQTTTSSPAATALPTQPIFNAVASVGEIAIDQTPLAACLLQKVDFSLDNKVAGKTGVGVLGYCDASGKSIALTGNISLYFNDQTYYNKYRNSQSFALSFIIQDSLGNVYSVYLPNCKFDSATANVTGKDDDVMLEGTFVAIVGSEGFTILMSRALA